MTKRREFLQLAKTFNPEKDNVSSWYISEKLDGTRCLWDGGITRGMKTVDVPWASTIDPKTGQMKRKIKPYSTGLWSRYGNPIMAPAEFLDSLPPIMLDGELWAGRGKFQLCRSICGGDEPDPRFMQNIKFAVYGSPDPFDLFVPGEIKNSNFHCTITEEVRDWACKRIASKDTISPFEQEMDKMTKYVSDSDFLMVHDQFVVRDNDHVESFLEGVLDLGGEGVVLRQPGSLWYPKRMKHLLKYKPHDDGEGTLVGFTSGRKTDKGSKHLGKIGALILDYNGKRLELAGLTDVERLFLTPEMSQLAEDTPGQDQPPGTQAKHFKIGQEITFKHRGFSDDGIPKEARYFRKGGGVE